MRFKTIISHRGSEFLCVYSSWTEDRAAQIRREIVLHVVRIMIARICRHKHRGRACRQGHEIFPFFPCRCIRHYQTFEAVSRYFCPGRGVGDLGCGASGVA